MRMSLLWKKYVWNETLSIWINQDEQNCHVICDVMIFVSKFVSVFLKGERLCDEVYEFVRVMDLTHKTTLENKPRLSVIKASQTIRKGDNVLAKSGNSFKSFDICLILVYCKTKTLTGPESSPILLNRDTLASHPLNTLKTFRYRFHTPLNGLKKVSEFFIETWAH